MNCHVEKTCDYIKDYFPLTSTADLYVEMGKYQEAYELYTQAFRACPPVRINHHNDLFNYAKCAMMVEKSDADDIVILAIEQGVSLEAFQLDEVFHKLRFDQDYQLSEEWIRVKELYPKIRETYLYSVDQMLRDSIKKLTRLDQEYRRRSAVPDTLRRVLGIERDREIQTSLKDLIAEYGYIDIPLIGGADIDGEIVSIATILMHTPDDDRLNYWIPLLTKEVRRGRCSPYVIGALIDQYHVYNGRKQVLGMMSDHVADVQQANLFRSQIGLPAYEVDKKMRSLMRINPDEVKMRKSK